MSNKSHQLCRLWNGTATILTTNLLKSKTVDSKFNDALTQAAVAAFDDFTKVINNSKTSSLSSSSSSPSSSSSSSSSKKREDDAAPSVSRRRRRVRPSALNTKIDVPSSPPQAGDNGNGSSGVGATPNDNFFEFQRTRGYRLAHPSVSTCRAARQLEEEFIPNTVVDYLTQFPTTTTTNNNYSNIAQSIANELRTSGACLSIDLWAAVQRGKGAHHAYHVHEGTILSGVYYARCPPAGCAPLVLKKPSGDECIADGTANEDESSRYRYATSEREDGIEEGDAVIHPEEGQLILFPPWVLHGVPSVRGDSEPSDDGAVPRVSWAFNLTGRLASIGDPWSVTRPFDDKH